MTAYHASWEDFLRTEFDKPYFRELSQFLHQQYETTRVFPPRSQVFSAFQTDFNNIKVVILGQDPYHDVGQAHGLAFSVRPGIDTPPSLRNIFKEISTDLGIPAPTDPHLTRWSEQGVLLLNNVLTVEAHHAGSHRGHGWETFTETVVQHLNDHRDHLVFLLWGRDARAKATLIDQTKHLILEAPHPSPLSAHYGFFGCRHFSQTNNYLLEHDITPISW
jgi:uracil-DNA glycosylase